MACTATTTAWAPSIRRCAVADPCTHPVDDFMACSVCTPSPTSPSADSAAGNSREQNLTMQEFATLCREKCDRPAQGFEDGRGCGTTSHDEEHGQVFHFCGRHMAFAIGSY